MIKIVTFCVRDLDAINQLCRILQDFGLHAKYRDSKCSDGHGVYYEVFIGDEEINEG